MRVASLVATVLVAACAPAPPGTVDQESVALDVSACAQHEAPCVILGDVTPVESLYPGTTHAIRMQKGGSVSAPLSRPYNGKLRWIALGLNNGGSGRIEVKVQDQASVIKPISGFTRVEVDMFALQPAPGATITITVIDGFTDLMYVVGRWDP